MNKKKNVMLVIIKMADYDSVKWYLPYVYGNINVNVNVIVNENENEQFTILYGVLYIRAHFYKHIGIRIRNHIHIHFRIHILYSD